MSVPTVGQFVLYRLSEQDAELVNHQRTHSHDHHDDYRQHPSFQLHRGNYAHEGDEYPMLIVRVWGKTAESAVNGQVFLDGNDVIWATSVTQGEGPRTFTVRSVFAHQEPVEQDDDRTEF